MRSVQFGKCQRLTSEASQVLTQGVVPALLMCRLPRVFAHLLVSIDRKHGSISTPEVPEGATATVIRRNGVPQALTGGFTVIAHYPGDNLACAPTQDCPHPAFVPSSRHERPQFIDFQHIFGLSRQQAFPQGRQLSDMLCQPTHHGLASDMEQSLQSAQAHPFLVSAQHLRAVRRRRVHGFQDPIRPTRFTMVLRTAAFIRTISDDVNAAACPTRVRDGLLDHAAHYHHSSLTPQPLPNIRIAYHMRLSLRTGHVNYCSCWT